MPTSVFGTARPEVRKFRRDPMLHQDVLGLEGPGGGCHARCRFSNACATGPINPRTRVAGQGSPGTIRLSEGRRPRRTPSRGTVGRRPSRIRGPQRCSGGGPGPSARPRGGTRAPRLTRGAHCHRQDFHGDLASSDNCRGQEDLTHPALPDPPARSRTPGFPRGARFRRVP